MQDILERAARVRLAVFDVDGVLTDGALLLGENGQEYKVFHTRDGQGLVMLLQTGVQIGVISGRSSPAVAARMHALGIRHVFQGNSDKLPIFEGLLAELGLEPEQAAYLGDDLPDLPIMLRVGLSAAVADAHDLVLQHAQWRTPSAGGRGAAREFCELIMQAQGSLAGQYARYLDKKA